MKPAHWSIAVALILIQGACGDDAATAETTTSAPGPTPPVQAAAPDTDESERDQGADEGQVSTPPPNRSGSATVGSRNPPTTSPATDPSDLLTYPRYKHRVMASVNGRSIELEEIVQHIDSRHFPGFTALISGRAGQAEVRSIRMADWTRQFADLACLQAEARKRELSQLAIEAATGDVYHKRFEIFVKNWETANGRTFPTNEGSVRTLRSQFQKRSGIELEVEGLLNALLPDDLDQVGADDFFKAFSREISGVVTVSHIFIQNRDRKTGALYGPEKRQEVDRKLRDIKRRLEAGSVFEEVAIELTEDRRSASRGARLENLLRHDPRMPASFCRAAWSLGDGEWVGPVESKYGIHFIKLIKWIHNGTMILRLDPTNELVRKRIRTRRSETLLFELRQRSSLTLLY